MADIDGKDNEVRQLMDQLAKVVIGCQTIERIPAISHNIITELMMVNSIQNTTYYTGSVSEGIHALVCNDIDIMECTNQPTVCWNTPINQLRGNFYVEAVHNKKNPAYVQLKVLDRCKDFEEFTDSDGFLKGNYIIENGLTNLNKNRNFTKTGPSLLSDAGTHTDNVFCLQCLSWPPSARNFFSRERQNWPSQELLGEVKELDSFVVAVPHPTSLNKDIEWRLSFSLAERELIRKMPVSFFQCMSSLRAIKNKYLVYSESKEPTPFSSYLIKTACLWVCETYTHNADDYNLISIIKDVLDWLIKCYQRKELPHYFIPQQNLISHLSDEDCCEVNSQLLSIRNDVWPKVMPSCQCIIYTDLIINKYVCSSLNLQQISTPEDYQYVESELLKNPKSMGALKSAISFTKSIKYNPYISYLQENFIFPANQLKLLEQTHHKLDIVKYAETVVLAIIENLKRVLLIKEHEPMYKTYLYRHLANTCTSLLVLQSKCTEEEKRPFIHNPLRYLDLGGEMIFPDKSSDCGLGGIALVAKYHYLLGNYTELEDTFTEFNHVLNRLLKTNKRYLDRPIGIQIDTKHESEISYREWITDEVLQYVIKRLPPPSHFLHPVRLVLYIKARVFLINGDIGNALKTVNEMKEYNFLPTADKFYTHNILINVIESVLGLLLTSRMICDI